MNNLTETQKEAISSLVNLTEEFCNRELSQKAERLKELFPEAFAEPKEQREKIIVEIEKNVSYSPISKRLVERMLTSSQFWNDTADLTVKELPELYTAEDMIEFAKDYDEGCVNVNVSFQKWKESKSTKSDERKEPFYALGVEFPNSNDDFGFELKRKPTIAK